MVALRNPDLLSHSFPAYHKHTKAFRVVCGTLQPDMGAKNVIEPLILTWGEPRRFWLGWSHVCLLLVQISVLLSMTMHRKRVDAGAVRTRLYWMEWSE